MNIAPDQMIADAKLEGEQAWGRLLEMYRNYLSLLARMEVGQRLQRKLDASDLVQETFLDAHRNFANFEGRTEAQFLAWLRTILAGKAANTIRHYIGTQGRDIRLEQELSASFDLSSLRLDQLATASVASPSQQAIRREQAVMMADTLQRLPEDYREVILLRHWEELSFPEIAARMKRTVDSVEKLWVRALARLRQVVGETR
ncbi:MAG: sigma-70 family RNA polymerase sigma factor [Planctomycetales bacterium]|nr:sigma-70 family RNA polymerase sigma factor [Planctomycetales bacterium]